MTSASHQLLSLDLGDGPAPWSALGFTVLDTADGPVVRLGGTNLRLTGHGGGILGWRIDGVDADIDGLRTSAPPSESAELHGVAHPNLVTRIDHVVISSPDHGRAVAALEAAGLERRGGRKTDSYGAPMLQSFHWAGDVIVELVSPEVAAEGATNFFGLALVSSDLDATAAVLGPLLGTPKPAVQPGRSIAGVRHRDAGAGVAMAIMSPHVDTDGPPR